MANTVTVLVSVQKDSRISSHKLRLYCCMIVELDGISILVTKKAIKNLNLRVYPPDGTVKVSAPLRYSERAIRKILEEKKNWIQEQQERIRNLPKSALPQLEHGIAVPFLGNNYLFLIKEHDGPAQIKIHGELMHCYAPHNSTPEQRQTILDAWYKQQMQLLLPDLIHHWEHIIGVKVAEWRIKKMKSRWGSCTIKAARICLNLNLIKKPQICLEYVLVHELVHLWEPSHNQRFYKLMTQFMPQWREYQFLLEGR